MLRIWIIWLIMAGISVTVIAAQHKPQAVPNRDLLYIESVQKDTITVSWTALQGHYDKLRLICTTKHGDQTYTDVHRGMNRGTCYGLQSGTEYYITLATVMDDDSIEAQLKFRDTVRTEWSVMDFILNNKCAVGGAILTSILALYAAPAALGILGFGAAGIGAGTVAASMMSWSATAGGGGIAAGSFVAILQSAGAAGIGYVTTTVLAVIGFVVGGGVGSATCTDNCD